MNQDVDKTEIGGTLGTFAGVFTPSVLTILGIILFLRLGYVVGEGGLIQTLIIVMIANVISILTTISLSAIATNFKVKGGGDYYLISRTLGVEFGGAIGIVLFLAQAVSIAFYCIGFGEAVSALIQGDGLFNSPRVIALCSVLLLFVFAWLGSDWASKFQFVVMGLLVFALLSFFVGGIENFQSGTLMQNLYKPASGSGFWILFAIFFPAVTGFTQGVSMSGDLKDPGTSLPKGTFAAVFLSMFIYFTVVVLFAGSNSLAFLASDYTAMKKTAAIGWLIDAGVISATLSSAMASFLGAPRILQSLSSDKIFKILEPFAVGSGETNNPRRAVLLAAVIAVITICLGNLNLIAPVVSMFFLISYGLLNYATFYEAYSGSPSFRPRYRWFDKRLSLAGCLACLGVMLAIDFSTGIVSVAILFAIYQYLKRVSGPARWADSRRSYYLQQVRKNLLSAEDEIEHPRNWSPRILAFSNDSHRRKPLLEFANWILGHSGMLTAVKILEGSGGKMLKLKKESETELKKDIDTLGIEAFHKVIAAPELQVGLQTLIQSFGIGPVTANTVLLNWVDRIPKGLMGLSNLEYIKNLKTAFRFGCNLVILDAKEDAWLEMTQLPVSEKQIAILWTDDPTSEMMLLLAYHLVNGGEKEWTGAKIRVFGIASTEDADNHLISLKQQLEDYRISAEPVVIPTEDAASYLIELKKASMVFLPFHFRDGTLKMPFGGDIESILSLLKVVVLVMAAEDIELEAGPEDGKIAEIATAQDAIEDKAKVADKAEKEAQAAAKRLEELKEKLDHLIQSDKEESQLTGCISEIKKAQKESEESSKRAFKKRAIADSLADEAEEL